MFTKTKIKPQDASSLSTLRPVVHPRMSATNPTTFSIENQSTEREVIRTQTRLTRLEMADVIIIKDSAMSTSQSKKREAAIYNEHNEFMTGVQYLMYIRMGLFGFLWAPVEFHRIHVRGFLASGYGLWSAARWPQRVSFCWPKVFIIRGSFRLFSNTRLIGAC